MVGEEFGVRCGDNGRGGLMDGQGVESDAQWVSFTDMMMGLTSQNRDG